MEINGTFRALRDYKAASIDCLRFARKEVIHNGIIYLTNHERGLA